MENRIKLAYRAFAVLYAIAVVASMEIQSDTLRWLLEFIGWSFLMVVIMFQPKNKKAEP